MPQLVASSPDFSAASSIPRSATDGSENGGNGGNKPEETGNTGRDPGLGDFLAAAAPAVLEDVSRKPEDTDVRTAPEETGNTGRDPGEVFV